MSVRYITVNDLYNINAEVTQLLPFVRDINLLNSAVQRPAIRIFGEEQFPTLLEKAAALLHSIAAHHLFVDGNKRTAQVAVSLFLEENNITPTWDDKIAREFILEIAQGKHDVEAVVEWLKQNTTGNG